MNLIINQIINNTKVEGPGNRTAIFVQGCLKKCPMCNSPQTWDLNGGTNHDVESLSKLILNNPEIEGVTFSGGEPFLQSKALYELGLILKKNNLSIVVFTGYEYDFIKKVNSPEWNNFLTIIDILISGKFIYEKKCTDKLWVGSSNQEINFLTDRYLDYKKDLKNKKNKIEIRLNKDGSIIVNGMGDNNKINELFKGL